MYKFTIICAVIFPIIAHGHRIVGGHEVTISEYYYQLSLQEYGVHSCGAIIISNTFALTAAHCIHQDFPSGLSVVGKTTNLKEPQERYYIRKTTVHPDYSEETIENDIAILELDRDFILDPAQDFPKLSNSDPEDGIPVMVSGWGLTEENKLSDILRAAEVNIVDRDVCKDKYSKNAITDGMICAGTPEGGKDSCQNDSGGPLVAKNILYGIVSWGHECGSKDYPGVYANVYYYRRFIEEITGLSFD